MNIDKAIRFFVALIAIPALMCSVLILSEVLGVSDLFFIASNDVLTYYFLLSNLAGIVFLSFNWVRGILVSSMLYPALIMIQSLISLIYLMDMHGFKVLLITMPLTLVFLAICIWHFDNNKVFETNNEIK